MKDLAAIDFEIANCEPTSVCSVGIVVVRDGVFTDRFYSLIQPVPNYYNYGKESNRNLSNRRRTNSD